MPFNSPGAPSSLRYFIAEQKSILVVSIVGSMVRENTGIMEEMLHQISEKSAKWIILNLRDVPPSNDRTVCPILAKLKKAARTRAACVRFTSVHPELRKFLESQGVVRPDEFSNNLAEALQTLLVLEKAAA